MSMVVQSSPITHTDLMSEIRVIAQSLVRGHIPILSGGAVIRIPPRDSNI